MRDQLIFLALQISSLWMAVQSVVIIGENKPKCRFNVSQRNALTVSLTVQCEK